MLWWKHLQSSHVNIMIFEMEEQRNTDCVDSTPITLTLPSIHPVINDHMLITNLEQVKTLQASLFPICSKGKMVVEHYNIC